MTTKYRSVRTNGYASRKEARRAEELRLLEKTGTITDLETQPWFDIVVNGRRVCRYRADFQYRENGKQVVEDVKGIKTPVYQLKKKLMYAVYGIVIFET